MRKDLLNLIGRNLHLRVNYPPLKFFMGYSLPYCIAHIDHQTMKLCKSSMSHDVKLGMEEGQGALLGAVGNDWPSRWVAPINAVRRGMTGKNLLFWGQSPPPLPLRWLKIPEAFMAAGWVAGWMYASSNGLRVVR